MSDVRYIDWSVCSEVPNFIHPSEEWNVGQSEECLLRVPDTRLSVQEIELSRHKHHQMLL